MMTKPFRTTEARGHEGTANGNVTPLDASRGRGSLGADFGDMLEAVVMQEAPPLYIADLNGTLVYANRAYREMAGLDVAADRELARGEVRVPASLQRDIERVRRDRKTVVGRESMVVLGRTKHFESRHFPIFDPHDTVVAVGGTYFDVTRSTIALERAKADRQRVDDFTRSTSDWVWETDKRGVITYISERITEALGLPPMMIKGRTLEDLGRFCDDDVGGAGAAVAMLRHAPFRNRLFEIRDRDGKQRSYHLSAVPAFDASGAFAGYRGTGTDVTALHAAEAAARESHRELERTLEELTNKNLQLDLALERANAATEAKDEFLATMSHELRTPLNAIIGFAEVMTLATFGPLGDVYQEYAENITKAGRHLLGIINDVLDIAGIENNTFKVDAEPIELGEVLEDAFSMVMRRATEKSIEVSGLDCGPWTVLADKQRTMQIFVNLFSNAVKFTPTGGNVGVEVARAEDDFVAVTVWDTGQGIPRDKQQLVFEKFHQVHDGIFSRSQEGTGLGLTVSRHLARLMGGDITLWSEVGQGCRLTVTLPLVPEF